MTAYIIRRLLYTIPIVFGVLLVTFLLFNVVAGDVTDMLAGKAASAETRAEIRKEYGWDKPLFVSADSQFINHLKNTLKFNFGRSWNDRERIIDKIKHGALPSLSLTVPMFLITLVIGLIFAGYFMDQMNTGMVYLAETNHLIQISRQHQKDFLLSKDTDAVDRFSGAYAQAQGAITKLKGIPGLSDDTTLDSLESSLARFRSTFLQIVEHQKLIGLDENSGLKGEIRQAIHDAEDIFRASGNDTLISQMLIEYSHI